MSIHTASQALPTALLMSQHGPSMADVLDRLGARTDLTNRRRDGLLSAARTFCRGLGKTPIDVSAEPRAVRQALRHLSPGALGLSPGSFRNLRSLVAKAVQEAGIETVAVRYRIALSPEWAVLVAGCIDDAMKYALKRPLQLLSEADIRPDQVDQTTFESLALLVEDRQILRRPRAVATNFAKQWNRAVRLVPGWPKVELRIDDRRNRYVLPPEMFPPSLRRDIDAWLRASATPSLRSKRPAIRPATLAGHRAKIWELASAAVHAGVPIDEIESLRALVQASIVERGLEWIMERLKGRPAPHLFNLARLACAIARGFVEQTVGDSRIAEEHNLADLKLFRANLQPESAGMTTKNRELLRRLSDPEALARLLTLPRSVLRKIYAKRQITRNDAARGRDAIAIETLLHAPVRIENLSSTNLESNYRVYGTGRRARTVIEYPAAQVKNSVDLAYPLPKSTTDLIEEYRRRLLPILQSRPTPFLFPGRLGTRPIDPPALSSRIASLCSEIVGFRVSAHQFRHICAFIYLRRHPGDYETVRAFLGHKKIETTIRFYAGMEAEAAVELFDKVLAEETAVADELLRMKRPRRRP